MTIALHGHEFNEELKLQFYQKLRYTFKSVLLVKLPGKLFYKLKISFKINLIHVIFCKKPNK